MVLVGAVAIVTYLTFAIMLRPLIMSTCDPIFFEAQMRCPWIVDQAFMFLLVFNLLAAFETLGTLMAVGLMILPATAARYWSGTITAQLGFGCMFASVSCWAGLILSYMLLETPTGPYLVLVAGVIFGISSIFGSLGSRSKFNEGRHF